MKLVELTAELEAITGMPVDVMVSTAVKNPYLAEEIERTKEIAVSGRTSSVTFASGGRNRLKKCTYNVYVIELSRDVLQHNKFVDANPYMRADKPCVYVGSTYLTPEKRYEQHLRGHKSNRYVREYAIELKPRLYANWQGYATRELAEQAEVKRAESLRRRGYAVWYG